MAVGKRMTKSPSRSPCAAGTAGLAFAAVMAVAFPLLADEPAVPPAAEPAVPPTAAEAEAPAATPAQRQTTEASGETGRDDSSDVENDLRRDFNDLRRELLDYRMKFVDWWLMVMAIFLTLLGIGAVIAGYLGFKRFREIEAEARGNVDTVRTHADEARKLVDKIEETGDEATSLVKGITAETAAAEPNRADEAVRSAQADPAASSIDREVSATILFQRLGNIEEAIEKKKHGDRWLMVMSIILTLFGIGVTVGIPAAVGYLGFEKWRAVANVVDGTNAELGAQGWFSIGNLHGEKSRHQEAINAYDEAIRLKSDMAEAYINRGIAKQRLGQYGEAIADYDEAIRLKPDYAGAYYNRGHAKDDLGQYEEAINAYDEAIRLKSDMAEAYINRGIAKQRLGQYGEAIADYDEAIRLKPDYAGAYYNRGIAKQRLGQYEEAIADFGQVIRLEPDNATAYYNRANVRFTLGHKDKARQDFEKALALARAAGDETVADTANRAIERLFGGGDP